MRRGRFEIYGSYFFRLRAPNNQILLVSACHATDRACRDAIVALKAIAFDERNFERRTAIDGRTYFVLKARDGEPLATSEMHANPDGCDGAIAAVKLYATMSPVVSMP